MSNKEKNIKTVPVRLTIEEWANFKMRCAILSSKYPDESISMTRTMKILVKMWLDNEIDIDFSEWHDN